MESKHTGWSKLETAHTAFSEDLRYTLLVAPLREKGMGQRWYAWYVLDDEDALIVAQGHQPTVEDAQKAADAALADEISPVSEKTDAG